VNNSVEIENKQGIVVATINRPNKLNAADLNVYHRLEESLKIQARAHVITGAKGNFSAGDDVALFSFNDVQEAQAFIVEVQKIFEMIEGLPRPVVAAVEGYALGFGFELALACDVIVATPDAVFGLPEITHGAAPPNAICRGVDVLGRGIIRHMALMGKRWLTGRQAYDLGMVAELHSRKNLMDAAVEIAGEMAGNPDFPAAKRLVNLEAGSAYRIVPMVMPQLMATPTVKESQRRYMRDD
jgi:enoyl-CoA hydratase/carnithine racemase